MGHMTQGPRIAESSVDICNFANAVLGPVQVCTAGEFNGLRLLGGG